jgi:geranylgeranyl pyrophosphate synthase
MRASLTLLAARLLSADAAPNPTRAVSIASAIEMIHAASLVHDDLIDDADVRRGRSTVHSKWGGNVALMVGDYLFALAAEQMADASDPRIIKSFARGVVRICEAELSPVTDVVPIQRALDQYFSKIGGKTAALFECAAETGMIVGGGDDAHVEALRQFGYDIGLAFQIVDDILDFTGDELTLGKPAGHDLQEGTITLPVIYAVDMGANEVVRQAAQVIEPSPELVAAAVAEVRRICATKRALADAQRLVDTAIERLAIFPDSTAKDGLVELAELVLRRKM